MRHFYLTLSLAAMLTALTGCGGDAIEKNDADIREAEMAISQGDMRVAESVANHVLGSADTSALTPSQFGRLSMVLMQIADSVDQGDHVALAARCYRKAYDANADSARSFYANVAPEHVSHAVMLATLVGSQDIPVDSLRLDE